MDRSQLDGEKPLHTASPSSPSAAEVGGGSLLELSDMTIAGTTALLSDMQSQVLLSYRSSDLGSCVFSRVLFSCNQLGLNKLLQAYSIIPGMVALLTLYASFAGASVLGLSGSLVFAAAIFSAIVAAAMTAAFLAWQVVQLRGPGKGLSEALEPDHIVLSPQGISLQWSGKFVSLKGFVLPWRAISLAYVEHHQSETESYQTVCLRDSLGRAMVLDRRALDNDFLISALKRRAPAAVDEPPMVLALQPCQRDAVYYNLHWRWLLRKGLISRIFPARESEELDTILPEGYLLKSGKYRIGIVQRRATTGITYLADTVGADEGGLTRVAVASLVDAGKTVAVTALRKVNMVQLVFPPCDRGRHLFGLIARAEREVRRLSGATSKHICRWLDVFVEHGRLFVVFEHVSGETLRQIVEGSGPLRISDVLTVGLAIANALVDMHAMEPPMVHGAITPDAVAKTAAGQIKIIDFAFARELLSEESSVYGADRRYSAIELLRGFANSRSDIYSVGAVMFYLSTGRDPDPLAQSHPRTVDANITVEFDAIVARATALESQERFQTAEDLATAIRDLIKRDTSLVLL